MPEHPLSLLLDAVIGLTVVEGLGLWLYHRWTGRGVAPGDYALNLISGLLLMLTLRSALQGAPWPMTIAFFAASGTAHGLDLWRRWQQRRH